MRPARLPSAAVTATALSAALHAVLLLTAAVSIFSRAESPRWIRVSLLASGGRGGETGRPGAGVLPVPGNNAAASTRVGSALRTAAPEPSAAARAKRRRQRIRGEEKQETVEPLAQPLGALADSSGGFAAAGPGAGSAEGSGGGGDGAGFGGRGDGDGSGSGHAGDGDLRAFCLSCPKPQYPRLARLRRWEGTVDVEVALGSDGKVSSARIVTSSGYEVLDEAALAAARQSRFHLLNARTLHGRMAYGFRLSRVTPR